MLKGKPLVPAALRIHQTEPNFEWALSTTTFFAFAFFQFLPSKTGYSYHWDAYRCQIYMSHSEAILIQHEKAEIRKDANCTLKESVFRIIITGKESFRSEIRKKSRCNIKFSVKPCMLILAESMGARWHIV
ncbi:hypothetical protein NPIL_104811 [Nephila pilipes]|uniref:Uncharacterized protein n=1 Tax=Nephila pilipes TaxID=299642 RepID=A0A8X6USC4_NEPPI|nr:hypothetical protein NPIL_104811 [Nephila pilipes]